MQVLPRGGVLDLPDGVHGWTVSVSWPKLDNPAVEVDVVAFLTDQNDEVRADSDFIFYNAPAAASGAVELTLNLTKEAIVAVRLDRVPFDVDRVTVAAALSAGAFQSVGALHLNVTTGTGDPHIKSIIDAATTEKSLILARFYRRAGRWRFRAVGQGYEFGLARLATTFGVEVDD